MSFRKKWDNYWYYHKWHTVIGAILIVFVFMTAYQMMTRTVYDNSVVVAGNVPATLSDLEGFESDIIHCFKDTNKDGEININTTFVPFGGNIDSVDEAEMALVYPQQLQALIAADDANIFIVTEDILIDYGKANAFADVTDVQKELGISDCKYKNGILITDKNLIDKLQLYSDVDYYIAVRVHDELETMNEKKRISYENAYVFMRELFK